jgi:signal transduction histidine kinase
MPNLYFTVDSALLRELGERLVGKPHIALAELVKNGYDADAARVTIEFALEKGRIVVHDDGHGMDFGDFENYWMRIGTPHQGEKRKSKYLRRPLTGSKGVGRLAVQFLAEELRLITVPKDYPGKWIEAYVNWKDAVTAGDLTQASVEYSEHLTPPPFERGTEIVLTSLKNEWDERAIKSLARELWWLQPPFRSPSSSRLDARASFEIEFHSTQKEFQNTFDRQIRAIMGFWTARLVGKNEGGNVQLSLEFAGEAPQAHSYRIADFPHNAGKYNKAQNLNEGDFEIRIFKLQYRQPAGIKVDDAREYFEKFGGVHVYDGGFRLPYYGVSESDWLRLEIDHSHRKFLSDLLPLEFQKAYEHTQRLRFLPTLERIFGIVNISTSREPNLEIMITRDRLAESVAFEDLRAMVRYALDLYAFDEARRQYEEHQQISLIEPSSLKFERVEQVLKHYEPEIPREVYEDIRQKVQEATTVVSDYQGKVLTQMSLLAPLATAGISALAFQHELKKQFGFMESIVERIRGIHTDDFGLRTALNALGDDLSSWLERARATNGLFDYMADAENTKERHRYKASVVLRDTEIQTEFLARGIEVDITGIDDTLLLPEASRAEWGAIFQNIFTNAFKAMLDLDERLLRVVSRVSGKEREILVQDTGCGVDLKNAERLFEPFERGPKLSPERMALGYGGTGLGLTIVRLLADRIGCKAGFVEPEIGFRSAFSIRWREKK